MLSKRVKARRRWNRDRRHSKAWQKLRNILVHRLYLQLPSQQLQLSAKHLIPEERVKIYNETRRTCQAIALEVTAVNRMFTRQEVHEYHRNFHLRLVEIHSEDASLPEIPSSNPGIKGEYDFNPYILTRNAAPKIQQQ